MKTTRFAQESAAQAQAEAQENRRHTPGPWNAFRYPDCRTWTVAADTSVANRIVREGDARLIAAAPEMLEALDPDALEAIADELFGTFQNSARAESLRVIARKQGAAIAKATGK